jgi:hypothetical protein
VIRAAVVEGVATATEVSSAQAMPVAAPMMSRIAPDSEAVETSIG